MKKLSYLIVLALILGLVLTGCSLLSNISQVPATDQSGITYLTKHTADDPQVIDLLAGQTEKVGEVEVWNDEFNLYVKYIITDLDWCLTETHLHVATSLGDIPQKNGNPPPGKFDYKEEHDCLADYTYEIPLDWDPEIKLFIAAHAKVIRPIDDCNETVWQIGDVEVVNTVTGWLENYADEFNWGDPAGPITMGPSLAVEEPLFTDPFIVETTPTDEFPYNSNYNRGYAANFDVQWTGSLPFGGLLTLSWSPGASGAEIKVVSDGGITSTIFTATGAFESGKGWFMNKYPLVEHSVNVDPLAGGLHTINFQHTLGNGTFWDWIRLEKPCEREETAWGAGFDFPGKNWATYFTYTVQLPQDGMVLWLDAGKGITATSGVSKWEDQSGSGNHAVQATASYQPTYVEGELNDNPVVRFPGGEKYLRHSPILTDSYTAFYVLKLTESGDNLVYYYHAGSVNTGDLGFFAETKNKEEGWGSAGNVDTSVTVRTSEFYPTPLDWRIHTHQPEALYKDGVEVVYGRDDNVYAGGLTDIGSRSDHLTLFFVGDIAEILVYDRILTVHEREMVETYLKVKYDL